MKNGLDPKRAKQQAYELLRKLDEQCVALGLADLKQERIDFKDWNSNVAKAYSAVVDHLIALTDE